MSAIPKMYFLVPCLGILGRHLPAILLACLPAGTVNAMSEIAIQGPVDVYQQRPGLLTANSGVVSFPHGSFIGSTSANDRNGTFTAYSSSSLQLRSYGEEPVSNFAISAFSGSTMLQGPGSEPIDFDVLVDFDARVLDRIPYYLFGAYIDAKHENTHWQSLYNFGSPWPQEELSYAYMQVDGEPRIDLAAPAASVEVDDGGMQHLHGRLSLPFTLTPGQSLFLFGELSSETSLGFDYRLGTFEGLVDASMKISFAMPPGYSLVGREGAFSSVPIVAIPEPQIYALLMAALAVITYRLKHARRRSLGSRSERRST